MIPSQYLGLIPYREALAAQVGSKVDMVFGFECPATITLGVRSSPEDLILGHADLARRQVAIEPVDRGGQATLHMPGQLVIFPSLNVRALGVRAWVSLLLEVTRRFLLREGLDTRTIPGDTGLFSDQGKVVSLGLRIRGGKSTHGLAINIHNDLSAFNWIRACGQTQARVDRLKTSKSLAELFISWNLELNRALGVDNIPAVHQVRAIQSDVRL